MRKAVMVAVCAVLWASTAQAADVNLVPIGPSAGGASWGFVDRANVETAGATRTYWVLSVNTSEEAAMHGHIYYAMRRYTADCAAHLSQYTFVAFYERGGHALSHAEPHVDAAPIIPGTLGADIEGLVCKGEAPIVAQGFESIDDAVSWARKQAK